jgi:hypothetical protein
MSKRIMKWMLGITLVISLLLVSTALAQGTASIDWWVTGSGGGSATAAGTTLSGTLGQWATGSGVQGTAQLSSGFWGGGALTGPDGRSVYLPVILHLTP